MASLAPIDDLFPRRPLTRLYANAVLVESSAREVEERAAALQREIRDIIANPPALLTPFGPAHWGPPWDAPADENGYSHDELPIGDDDGRA